MDYCPNCGYELFEDSNFCPNCGSRLRRSSNASQDDRDDQIIEIVRCPSCGSTDVDVGHDGFGVCRHCNSKVKIKDARKNKALR